MTRRLHIDARASALILIDLQTRLAPAIHGIDDILTSARALLEGARTLEVPFAFTEHYPSGLGRTDPSLLEDVPQATVFEKIHFDATLASGLKGWVGDCRRDHLLIAGTETHVCVLQTALGLKALGLEVSIIADAVGSRRDEDRQVALRRMERAGIGMVTTEMVLFEWLERGDTPAFKGMIGAIRDLGRRSH